MKLYLDTSVVVALFVAENIMHSTVAQRAVSSATVLASGEITYAKEKDRIERENLKYSAGYQVLVFRYDEDWRTKITALL